MTVKGIEIIRGDVVEVTLGVGAMHYGKVTKIVTRRNGKFLVTLDNTKEKIYLYGYGANWEVRYNANSNYGMAIKRIEIV